ncbi:MAG: CynX/NimT family MFS transporter [Burkholderiales bacterium]
MQQRSTARWTAVWAVFAGGLVAGAYIGKVPPALPVLRVELGLTLVQSGFVATMFNVVGGLGGVLAGILADRFGPKRLALAGLAILSAGGFLGAAAGGFAELLLARFLEGAGFILFTVAGAALMAAAAPEPRARAKALSLWSAYMPAGGSLALLAAPLVIAESGWRGLWVALALIAAGAFALVARYAVAPVAGSVGSLRLAFESLAQRGSLVLALMFAFYVAQWTSVMIWLPTFVVDERGASDATAALLTALMVLINVPGNLAGGWLLARGARRGAMSMAAFAIMALCAVGMLLDVLPNLPRFLLVLVFSACAGVIPAAVFSGVPVHARSARHVGTGNGLVMQSSQASQFVAPILLAWLATRFGSWSASLWAMLALAACGAACGFALEVIEARRGR